MKLKKTNFICMTENDEKDLIIKNTLSGNLFLVKNSKKREFLKYWNKEEIFNINENKLYRVLYQKGFLIDEKLNEDEIVDILFNKEIYGNNSLEFTIIPTNACNFNCIYCYQKEPYFFMEDTTKNNIIKFLKKHIGEYSGIKISWFGGEPLLAKDLIIEIMEKVRVICLNNKKPFYSNMTTNGYELDVETFYKLITNHVRYFQITLDGLEEIHNIQRPHKTNSDSFTKIVQNLKKIKNNFNSYNYKIGLRINLSLKNIKTFKNFIDYLYKEFGNDKHFHIIFEVVRDWGGEKIKSTKKDLLTFENVNKYMDYVTQKGFELNKGFEQSEISIALCQASKLNGYVINYDGNLYKCAMVLEEEKLKKINKVGAITGNGDLEIDYAKMLPWIGKTKKDVKCNVCKFYPECMGIICPLSIILSGENNNCPDTFKNNYEYILKNNTLEKDIEELVW